MKYLKTILLLTLLAFPALGQAETLLLKHGFYMENVNFTESKMTEEKVHYILQDSESKQSFSIPEKNIKALLADPGNLDILIPITLEKLPTYLALVATKEKENTAPKTIQPAPPLPLPTTTPEPIETKDLTHQSSTLLVRSLGMGETKIGVPDSLNSIIGNPAGLKHLSSIVFGITYGAITQLDNEAVSEPLDTKAIGLAFPINDSINLGFSFSETREKHVELVRYYSYSYSYPYYYSYYFVEETYYRKEQRGDIALSFKANELLSLGIGYQTFTGQNFITAGLMFTPLEDLNIGIMYENHPDSGITGVGASYKLDTLQQPSATFLFAADLKTHSESNYTELHLGTEFIVDQIFKVRLGYLSTDLYADLPDNWFTFGFGGEYRAISLDAGLKHRLHEKRSTEAYAAVSIAM